MLTFDLKITKTLAAQYAHYKGFNTEEQLIPISVKVAGFQAVTWIGKSNKYDSTYSWKTFLHSSAQNTLTFTDPPYMNANRTVRNF